MGFLSFCCFLRLFIVVFCLSLLLFFAIATMFVFSVVSCLFLGNGVFVCFLRLLCCCSFGVCFYVLKMCCFFCSRFPKVVPRCF